MLRALRASLLPSLPINSTFNLGTMEISSVQNKSVTITEFCTTNTTQTPAPTLIEIKPESTAVADSNPEWTLAKLLGVVSIVSVGLIMVVAGELRDERERRIELEEELDY